MLGQSAKFRHFAPHLRFFFLFIKSQVIRNFAKIYMKLNGLLLVYVYQIYAFSCAKVLPRFVLGVRSGLQKKPVVERCMLVAGASYRKYGKKTLEPTDAPVRLFESFLYLAGDIPQGSCTFH